MMKTGLLLGACASSRALFAGDAMADDGVSLVVTGYQVDAAGPSCLIPEFDGAFFPSTEGCAIVQVLHGTGTTTEAIRQAIEQSQAGLRTPAKRYGVSPKTVAKWRKGASVALWKERSQPLYLLVRQPE